MRSILGHDAAVLTTRALAGVVGGTLLLIGLAILIMPELVSTMFLSLSTGGAGINSLRADIGALFLGMGVFALLGTLSRYRWLLLVPTTFLGLVVTGRVISMVLDPFPTRTTSALVLEIVFGVILTLAVLTHALSGKGEKRPGATGVVLGRRFLIAAGLVIVFLGAAFLFRPQISSRIWSGGVAGRMGQSVIATLPDGLHVGLAGTGAPMPDAQRVGISTFVIAGEHQFIVDCGPGSTLNLELMQVPLEETTAVLLTHFHSDHIGDLDELMLKIWTYGARTEPTLVMGPVGVDMVVEGYNMAFSLDAGYRIAHHGDAVAPASGSGGIPKVIDGFGEDESVVIFDQDGVKVTAFLVSHAPVDPALGFRFDYGGRSVVLSGDTLPDETLMAQSQGVDILVHDAMNPDMLNVMTRASEVTGDAVAGAVATDIQTYHAFTEETARIARDAGVRHLVLNQILPPIPASILHPAFLGDARRIFNGPITVSYDGMLFSLPANSNEINAQWLLY
ncbi:MAG: MBL fold metallo-hydrolase [Candidatus Bipolaricaulota bacterium]